VPFFKRTRRGQSYHDVRRHVATVACENCKTSVLTKAQEVRMNFYVSDDTDLLNILLDVKGL
jgi:hypothetical protein